MEKILITDTLESLTEKERGPLYGIPFSVKEHFFIKGKDSTVGLYSRIGQPATENAQISKYLHIRVATYVVDHESLLTQ